MRPLLRVATTLMSYDLRRYALGGLLWLPVSVLPLAGGLLLKALFDDISVGADAAGVAWLCLAFLGVEVVRGVIMVTAWSYGVWWWNASATVLRANVLHSLLTARGPAAARLPSTSGEAIGRLRDDVSELVDVVDELVTLTGAVLFTAGALTIMSAVDPVVTLVLVLPMLAVGIIAPLAAARVRRLHTRAQALGATVTGYVGELFGGVLAIKTAGAEDAALHRLAEHNRRRRDAAVRDRLAADVLDTATNATVEISIGLVLLLSAGAMRRGDFTVGDFALFTTYVSWLTGLPRSVGALLFRVPRAAVATTRLTALLAGHETAADLVRDTGVYLQGDPPPAPAPPRGEPLRTLAADGLTVAHGGGRGLHDVTLRLDRGTVTAVTGPVGAGKSTLVRALLGLEPLAAGTITWNGTAVDDPGTFLVPGRVAYAGQVPRLLSATLRENLLLGWDPEHLDRALWLAALDEDVAAMPDGLDTLVGPRGTRLSGGQVQRAIAARALVRDPDLLVLDDLSSALDVETELLLWDRLTGPTGPSTMLVVSHRQAALERADHVIALDAGRLATAYTRGEEKQGHGSQQPGW